MIESVHCPECQTRYGLRRDRVRYGLRRARCFRCEAIFPIEEEVTHLLAAGLPQESIQETSPRETFSFAPFAVAAAHTESQYQEPADLAEMPEVMPDSLTLQDLEGAEEEILDKTLADFRPPVLPEEPPMVEEPSAIMTTGGFSSARDAIDKLLGVVGPPPEPTTTLTSVHSMRARSTGGEMDVEATLSALDDTLGGNKVFELAPSMPTPKELNSSDWDVSLMDLGEPPAMPPQGVIAPENQAAPATVRLSREELLSAMSAPVSETARTTNMPMQDFPELHPELESTLVLTPPPVEASFFAPPSPPAFAPPSPPAFAPPSAPTSFMPVEESQDQNLFRVQLGTDTLSNLSMEQMTNLVNEGRLADYHMVARQFSENWIEAGKVPALRPIFERVRRERMPPPPPVEPEAPKRSLFGGLFGKKEG